MRDVFGAATSAASTVTIGVPPAISFAAQPTSLTVVHGSSGTITITGTPVGGYTGTVTFACGKLPSSASCTFAPSSLTFSGNNAVASTTLTFPTTATTALLERLPGATTLCGVFAAFLIMPIMVRKDRKRTAVRSVAWLLLIGGSLSVLGLSGCGGGGSKSPTTITTAPGTYTVPVTITAGPATSTLNLSVTAQ